MALATQSNSPLAGFIPMKFEYHSEGDATMGELKLELVDGPQCLRLFFKAAKKAPYAYYTYHGIAAMYDSKTPLTTPAHQKALRAITAVIADLFNFTGQC